MASYKFSVYTLEINRDDRGRLVAELWHDESGKTVGITEVDNIEQGRHWGVKTAEMQSLSSAS